MSRILKRNHKYEMAFGRDHVFGLFLQIFPFTLADEDPIEDKDEVTPEEIIRIGKHYGFTITPDEVRKL